MTIVDQCTKLISGLREVVSIHVIDLPSAPNVVKLWESFQVTAEMKKWKSPIETTLNTPDSWFNFCLDPVISRLWPH